MARSVQIVGGLWLGPGGYVSFMTERDSEQKKVGLTAVRIPLLILGALVVMLVIGMLIIG
jgi:hypothetical protein